MSEGRCLTCGLPLPCTEHPAPPKLEFVGGKHFEPNPEYKKQEGKREVSGAAHDHQGAPDDADRAQGSSELAAPAGGGPRAMPPRVHAPPANDAVPLRVAEASHRLSDPCSVAALLEQAKTKKLESVLILGFKDDGTVVFLESPTMGAAEANWLLDVYKNWLMSAEEDAQK